jgi:Phosphoglucomutase
MSHVSEQPMTQEDSETKAGFRLDDLLAAYFDRIPDMEDPSQRVSFGTSGHRGSSLNGSFTESHILAVSQAVCDFRLKHGINGPLFLGRDTHALSAPALDTALQVLAANGVHTCIQSHFEPTPTPVISQAVIRHNIDGVGGTADGIVITPSHNPPEDGGFKYNEHHGGPAGAEVTAWIETRANALLASGNREVRRLDTSAAFKSRYVQVMDFIDPYVEDLKKIIDFKAISGSGLKLGADPLGGSSLPFWEPIAERYKIDITVVNPRLDPLFGFMPLDHDGKIRMDCSSPDAMAGLIAMSGDFDIAFGNDPDADRHGIVTRRGLLNPNHYLSSVVWYLLHNRSCWPGRAAVGKTVVTTSFIDVLCQSLGRAVHETPVGFKWFVEGLGNSSLLFGGEESAGASFLRFNGGAWTTDKDGIILNLLAAEIMAVTGKDPAELYEELVGRFGEVHYARKDAPATAEEKRILKSLTAGDVKRKELAGHPVTQVLSHASGNQQPIGGIKVVTDKGWFAARPSGTENLYKIYAESFASREHLGALQKEAQELVSAAFASQGAA